MIVSRPRQIKTRVHRNTPFVRKRLNRVYPLLGRLLPFSWMNTTLFWGDTALFLDEYYFFLGGYILPFSWINTTLFCKEFNPFLGDYCPIFCQFLYTSNCRHDVVYFSRISHKFTTGFSVVFSLIAHCPGTRPYQFGHSFAHSAISAG